MKLDTFRSKLMAYGPIGYWRLNDTTYARAVDATGLRNNAAYSSPAVTLQNQLAPGIYGAGFTGSDSVNVQIPNISAFRIPILGVILTLKDTGTAANGRIVGFTGGATSSPGWAIQRAASGAGAALILDTSGAAGQSFNFPGTPFDGNWHTLAWGFDSANVYVATDFSAYTASAYTVGGGPVPLASTAFYLGRNTAAGNPGKASISDFALFPYVLLAPQLSSLSTAQSSGNDSLEYILMTSRELLVADLFAITLADGTALNWTSFDFDVKAGATTYSSVGPRIKRGAIKWKRGVEASPLEINIASVATDIAELGLTVAQAITAGFFNGASVTVSRAYNPSRLPNGTYSASTTLMLFQGWVGKIDQGRPYAKVTVNSIMERLNLQWPFTMVQPSCRWTLFDTGCTLNQASFAVSGTTQTGSTRSRVQHLLTNATGYFDQGRIKFTSGQNNGLWRIVQAGTAQGASASYKQTVLNDKPSGYWRLNDASGSSIADSSGNGYTGTKHGTITFGQTGALVGDATQASMLFDGATGYITLPIPKPSGYAAGITFEVWFKLPSSPPAGQPIGIFDTSPNAQYQLRNYVANANPGFEWMAKGHPSVGFNQPAANIWVHVCVVFRGQNAIDLYYNGQLYSSASAQGAGRIDWTNPITIGNINGGAAGWFSGYLQELAIYPYAMSADQPLAHYNAGTIASSTNGNGIFILTQPLPYAPQNGDTFTVYPGCDKSQRTCSLKFNNLANFGGFPYVPAPETAA